MEPTTSREGDGQLLDYYRREKLPPGARAPSVWDQEEEEPVGRLSKPPARPSREQRARAVAEAIASDAYPGAPARRRGPRSIWRNHEYVRRAPNELNPGEPESADEVVGGKPWPTREEPVPESVRRTAAAIISAQCR